MRGGGGADALASVSICAVHFKGLIPLCQTSRTPSRRAMVSGRERRCERRGERREVKRQLTAFSSESQRVCGSQNDATSYKTP
eukprot:3586819-Rhodomonas_salina.2